MSILRNVLRGVMRRGAPPADERVEGRDDDSRDTLVTRARSEQMAGRLDVAAAAWQHASERFPDDATIAIARAYCELLRVRAPSALALIRDVLQRHPERWDAHAVNGAILAQAGRLDDCVEAYRHACRLAQPDGDPSHCFVELAIALCASGRTEEGARLLLERLPGAPVVRGHRQLATAALARGWYGVGWKQLEYRWFEGPVAATRQPHPSPRWDGQDLKGKTILLRSEQGIGDTIQYVRYAPLVKARGARVLLQPLIGMEDFSSRFDGVDALADDPAAIRSADFYADLMSLPAVFATVEATIPTPTRLKPGLPEVATRWARRLADAPGPRVGLVWAGRPEHPRDRERSIALERLRPLLDRADVTWVALQKGAAGDDWVRHAQGARHLHVGPDLATLDDAAAVLEAVDLLVTVDTSLAHLAGTLGKPVWLMLPRLADCRWLEDREDSPWYPTMRLFRQDAGGAWEPVVERVRRELERACGAGSRFDARASAPAPSTSATSEPATPAHLAQVVETRAGLLQCDASEARVGRALAWYGEYLHDQLDAVLRLIRPGDCWAEIEAGVGAHAVAMARPIGTGGRLLYWESNAIARRMLANNLAANGIRIGAPLASARLDDGGADIVHGVKVGDPDHAVAALQGAAATLGHCRPWLVVATRESDRADVAARMRALGYRVGWMSTAVHRPANFHRRDSDVTDGRVEHALFGAPATSSVDLRTLGCTVDA